MTRTVTIALAISALAGCGGRSSEAPAAAPQQARTSVASALPALGTKLSDFPSGPGQEVARSACLACHSADMPRQQKLTAAQWAGEVDKMIRWGAAVPEDRKAALTSYLASNFGPGNDRFTPVVAAPVR